MKFNISDYRDRFVWIDKSHKNVQIVSDPVEQVAHILLGIESNTRVLG
jgi:hypothetical protein